MSELRRVLLSLAAAAPLLACAAPQPVTVERIVRVEVPPPRLIETSPVPAPPQHDISEADRRKWFDSLEPRVVYVPQPAPERVIVREQPVYVRDWYDRWDRWYLPVDISLGWWWGHGHGRHHGWGVGLGWRNGWWW